MSKKLPVAIYLLLSLLYGFGQSPELNAEKYSIYRNNLSNHFIYCKGDAAVRGSYLPMESIRISRNNKSYALWADAVWWQGHYIAMLATEYKLLKINGKNGDSVLKEIENALDTYYRLDLAAEKCWGGSDSLNGFFIRDDVDTSMIALYGVDFILSDYKANCGDSSTIGNAPSQDQLWGSYLGFALVNKLVEDDTIKSKVGDITARLIKAMQHTDSNGKEVWEIVNPVTGKLIQKSGDIIWMQYAHAQAGFYLSGVDCNFGMSNSTFWKDIWDLLQNNLLVNKNGNFSWYGVMACSAVINEYGRGSDNCYDWLVEQSDRIAKKRPDLQQTLIFPHLPLVAAVLHGYEGDHPLPASVYEDYFNSAPMEGAHNYTIEDSVFNSNPPWHSLSLFCPWHDHDNGKFNMLDYMLLYNLYQLTYKSELPEFKYLWDHNSNSN